MSSMSHFSLFMARTIFRRTYLYFHIRNRFAIHLIIPASLRRCHNSAATGCGPFLLHSARPRLYWRPS